MSLLRIAFFISIFVMSLNLSAQVYSDVEYKCTSHARVFDATSAIDQAVDVGVFGKGPNALIGVHEITHLIDGVPFRLAVQANYRSMMEAPNQWYLGIDYFLLGPTYDLDLTASVLLADGTAFPPSFGLHFWETRQAGNKSVQFYLMCNQE